MCVNTDLVPCVLFNGPLIGINIHVFFFFFFMTVLLLTLPHISLIFCVFFFRHILDNFVEIVETADSIIQSTAEQKELHSKVTNYKQHYIQKLEHHHVLREERLAILNAQNAPDESNIVK